MYIGDYSGRRALYTPDELAVVDAGKSPHRNFTYSDLDNRANRLANWLYNGAGIRKGDRVALLAYDGVEYLDVFFACSKLGAIMLPLNWRLHTRELITLLQDTTPSVLIYSSDLAETVEAVADATPSLSYLVHLGETGLPNSRYYEKMLSESVLRQVQTEGITEEDVVCLIFTGGTTGIPKAAQISHRMIAWNTLNTVIHDLQHNDVTVNSFPMFHTGGMFVYTLPLLILGGTVVLTQRFDAEQILNLIESYGASVYAGVPTTYRMLIQAENWPAADLSSLRFCTSGGATLPTSLVEKFQQDKGVQLKQGFGMSEFGPGVFALATDDANARVGSIGRPNFFVEARIVDSDRKPLPPGEVGEHVERGPSMFSGYFNRETDTATVLDDDGWLHTGDLAMMDDRHYFTVVDRKKDLFISGGEKIYPTEIEDVLVQHPAVEDCAVVGVPDNTWGEVGKAFVVRTPDVKVTEADLIGHLQHHLAGYKVPKFIEFRDTLPTSVAGKIVKRELTTENESS